MRIFVGLSGGVDSAVSAALLQRDGHEVTGAFIKIWSPEFLECTWREDRIDAMRVCVALGIPFKEIDLSREYMQTVVDDMIENYKKGITPNPDVLCNRHIKFGAFKEWALAEGAERIATGHYAQRAIKGDTFYLKRGIDSAKDQSYFLYRMTRDDLVHADFPVGGMPKQQVRTLAGKFDLPVAHKHDSQGLCFVGDVSIPEFLSRYIELRKGAVVDRDGRDIGEHDGVALYTVGQRHGFRISGDRVRNSTHGMKYGHGDAGGTVPHYVVRGDIATNTLVVSADKADTLSSSCMLGEIHWIGDAPRSGETLDAQARYHAPIARATLAYDADAWHATFEKPELLSPGQSVVFYRDDECIGGGVISRTSL